eukprot:578614-Prymnesium_polylepis.1
MQRAAQPKERAAPIVFLLFPLAASRAVAAAIGARHVREEADGGVGGDLASHRHRAAAVRARRRLQRAVDVQVRLEGVARQRRAAAAHARHRHLAAQHDVRRPVAPAKVDAAAVRAAEHLVLAAAHVLLQLRAGGERLAAAAVGADVRPPLVQREARRPLRHKRARVVLTRRAGGVLGDERVALPADAPARARAPPALELPQRVELRAEVAPPLQLRVLLVRSLLAAAQPHPPRVLAAVAGDVLARRVAPLGPLRAHRAAARHVQPAPPRAHHSARVVDAALARPPVLPHPLPALVAVEDLEVVLARLAAGSVRVDALAARPQSEPDVRVRVQQLRLLHGPVRRVLHRPPLVGVLVLADEVELVRVLAPLLVGARPRGRRRRPLPRRGRKLALHNLDQIERRRQPLRARRARQPVEI